MSAAGRMRRAGHIRLRGKRSWELKFDAERDPATGKRKIQYASFKGTKKEAQVELARLIAAVGDATYVEPSKLTVAEHVGGRIDHWETSEAITARTAQRYRQLLNGQIRPHIGTRLVQKLSTVDVEKWHATLRTGGRRRGKGGVSSRTVVHAHRVLSHALDDAMRHGVVPRNVAKLQQPPRVQTGEMAILDRDGIGKILAELPSHEMYVPAILALFTGMRLSEVQALRWSNVDLDAKVIRVREALEETKAHGLQVKAPKTRAGRRDIGLPDIVVGALRDHRKQQLELRMALGAGKLPADALVLPTFEGGYRAPTDASRAWGLVADALGMPEITFHGLRHTHASQLIDAGVDIVTISKRLGHASPDVTLRVYAHLFRRDEDKAAAAINAALAGVAGS
jgi:integrase